MKKKSKNFDISLIPKKKKAYFFEPANIVKPNIVN